MNYGNFDDATREYIITKYVQQMPASDFKGETLCLRVSLSLAARLRHLRRNAVQVSAPQGGVRGEGSYKVFSPFSYQRSTRMTSSNVMSGWDNNG